MIAWRFLVPRLEAGPYRGDGMHDEASVEGRSVEFAWLGLHVQGALARERAWRPFGPGHERSCLLLDEPLDRTPPAHDWTDLAFGLFIGAMMAASGWLWLGTDAAPLGLLVMLMGASVCLGTLLAWRRKRS